MASNFDFLPPNWSQLKEDALHAEQAALLQPRTAAFYARRALEKTVKWLYDHDSSLRLPYQDNLAALIHEPTFQKLISPAKLFPLIRQIHKLGNQAAHSDARIRQFDGLELVKSLHSIFTWAVKVYTEIDLVPAFNQDLLPKADATEILAESKRKIEELQSQLQSKDNAYEQERKQFLKNEEELSKLQEEVQKLKKQNEQNIELPPEIVTEADTRTWIIDVMLRESGWDKFEKGRDIEYPVTGMPNTQDKGYVDYVLWGDDGLPLGIVEAKRTSADPIKGKRQAELYANCLEKETGQRPVIYYTNGYDIWLWDDQFYPPRAVQGYATRDELRLLINRRKDRKSLAEIAPKPEIINRPYQLEATKRVMERFEQERGREALLVMATGTGKTRMSISIVDMLMRQNWCKRVLFLADRTALVRQAKRRFTEILPQVSSVNLVEEKEKENTRLVFSTYHTIMNLIDESRTDGLKRFGTNHFDLIVIDEAHRSVYHKFRAIFEYFDSLLVGLTATPRDEVDKDTYSLFNCERNVPTFYFELEQAVTDGFLVPFRAVSVPLKFQREGIKYEDLSDEEKEAYEETFFDDDIGGMPPAIDPTALNNWLFNKDTVDKVLAHLMENGIKIEGGDKLGKTIIFAKNHNHAVFIAERFNANYPHYKGKFLEVIDNQIKYAHDLMDSFDVSTSNPFIAVSVDMMDTGIDVEEIVNLVFFKIVRSRTKFWQMVGRGTRLCEDLFGPGQDKECFYIFDYCQNFEFFGQNPQGVEAASSESLKQKIFRRRLMLARYIQNDSNKTPELEALHKQILDEMCALVQSMNVENFIVRPHRRHVERYVERSAWEHLNSNDYQVINSHLTGLPTPDDDDEFARRFDLLMLNLAIAVLEVSQKQEGYQTRVIELARELEKKKNIPAVAKVLSTVTKVQTEEFWSEVTIPQLEATRQELRDLVKFIDSDGGRERVYTDFEDEIGEGMVVEEFSTSYGDLTNYKLKVESFVRNNTDHITIRRLMTNQPITSSDLAGLEQILFAKEVAGSKEQFEKAYGKQPLGAFIRSLVGLDRAAAQEAFAEFLNEGSLNADQMTFINQIIDHLVRNGMMNPERLFEQPFTDLNPEGIAGIFPERAEKVLAVIDGVNRKAEVA